MHYQRGMSLSKLLVITVVVVLGLVLAMKVAPGYIEYYKILKSVKAVALEASSGKPTTVEEVRRSYDRRSEMDDVTEVKAADLDISKEGNEVVVSFAYTKKVRLFANVSLTFDFAGASTK